jgi:N-acetylglucosamine-6-phosphate deacetylase
LNIDETHGSIEAGKRADLVGIDVNGKVAFTMIGGKMIPPVSNR